MNKLNQIFPERPIIGMIHLAGRTRDEKVSRALEEMAIYQEEGVSGVIIEDYHGSPEDVVETLRQSSSQNFNLVRGINVLRNPYSAFELADRFGSKFIQFYSVQTQELNLELYQTQREKYPNVAVFGGVGFKYVAPTGNPLEKDLSEGRSRCEAIVTTGSGTGIATPTEKLEEFKRLLGDFPLIVGAGVNLDNAYEQLGTTDGAIIGSYFKPQGNTQLPIERQRVKSLMDVVRKVRELQDNSAPTV